MMVAAGSDDSHSNKGIPVKAFLGNTLYFLSQQYNDPREVIREMVQNAIDKMARHIFVFIDQNTRVIKVYDDGLGASEQEITKKFGMIAQSLKGSDEMGEKGIGNLAGLSIADEYFLITKDRTSTSDPMLKYSLKKSDLIGKAEVHLGRQIYPGNSVGDTRSGFRAMTVVQLSQVNERALFSLANMDQLVAILLDAFRRKLRENKIELTMAYFANKSGRTKSWETKVVPNLYTGTKLDTEPFPCKHGTVTFEMYFSPKPVEKPRIHIETPSGYSFSLGNLFMKEQMSPRAWDVFKKGYCEGVIRVDYCKISSDRSHFEWTDELEHFSNALEEYALQWLAPLVHEAESESRTMKYQKVSDDVLKRIATFFQSNPDKIPDILRGAEHAPSNPNPSMVKNLKDDTEPIGTGSLITIGGQKKPKMVVDSGIIRRRRESQGQGGVKGGSTSKNPSENPTTSSNSSSGPGSTPSKPGPGTRQQTVPRKSGNSLEIVYVVPDEETGMNWHSRRTNGAVIEINVQHSYFALIERQGMAKLREYVGMLVQKELSCASLEPAAAYTFNKIFEGTYLPLGRGMLEN